MSDAARRLMVRYQAELAVTAYRIGMLLAEEADERTQSCMITIGEIARRLGIGGRETVKRHLHTLLDRHIVTREEQRLGQPVARIIYTFTTCLPATEREKRDRKNVIALSEASHARSVKLRKQVDDIRERLRARGWLLAQPG